MSGLLNGYIKKIVARQGLASQVPALRVAEIGYDTDTKFLRLGDGTSTPPRVPTSKSTGVASFPSVTKLTCSGVMLTTGGHINGITLSALDQSSGVLRRSTAGVIGRSTFVSTDASVDINNPDGADDGAIDLSINMDTVEGHLDLNNLPFVRRSGDTMTGTLKLPALNIASSVVADRREVARTAETNRWAVGADSNSELGNNSGSNWRVSRYNDAGGKIDDPLGVNRASGMIELKHGIVLPDGTPWSRGKELPKDAVGYLYNDGLGNLSWRLVATVQVFPTSLLHPVQGTAYSARFTATGGSGAYTFSRTAGTLPTGLSLTTAGVLSGTPTVPGSFTFTITADDGAGLTGVRAYTLTVAANAGTYTILPSALPNATQGLLYAAQLSSSGTYAAPVTYAVLSGTLPGGLTLSSAGAIAGIPSVAGNFPFVVQATDNAGAKANITYILSVAANQFVFHVSYDVDNLNLFDFAGQPTYAGNFEFIIDGGVTVRSVSSALPALRTGVFGNGCTVKLTNKGSVHGMGGAGGRGGPFEYSTSSSPSEAAAMAGKDGGTAIHLDMPLTLDNTNGRIFGGGGGGAGGAMGVATYGIFNVSAPGGGGGGGQGAYTSNGGDAGGPITAGGISFSPAASGTPGGYSTPGMGGQGGFTTAASGGGASGQTGASGGQWGQAGNSLVVSGFGGTSGYIFPGVSMSGTIYGGAAGISVKTAGLALTWAGGNNVNQVKGAVS